MRCLVLIYKTSRDPQNVEGMLATVHLKLAIIDRLDPGDSATEDSGALLYLSLD